MKNMRNTILLAVDFRDQSLVAVEQTIDLAKFLQADILLLHVIDTGYFLARVLHAERQDVEELKAEADVKLKALADTYKDSGIRFSTRVEEGKIYERIIGVSDEIKARFIIIGKNETKTGNRQIMGSNATRVVTESHVPVISIAGERRIGYKQIVLPLDLTKKARGQVFNAIAFALHYQSTIHIVSVLMAGIPAKKSLIMKKMVQVKKTIEENGIQCTMQLFQHTTQPPYTMILDHARKINADLIMVMTHQEETSGSYIGAFAHQIINESDIPVLSLTYEAAQESDGIHIDPLIDPFSILTETPGRKRFRVFGLRRKKTDNEQ